MRALTLAVAAEPLAELTRRSVAAGELAQAPQPQLVLDSLAFFGAAASAMSGGGRSGAEARQSAQTYSGSELCRRATPATLWAVVRLFLGATRQPLVPAAHLSFWHETARMPASRARLFRVHCLLLALPRAHQVTLGLVLSTLHDVALTGAGTFAELAVELARALIRERLCAERFDAATRLYTLCEELLINQSTVTLGLCSAAELHSALPATRHIDLSSSAQAAVKAGFLHKGTKSFGGTKWQQHWFCVVGSHLVQYATRDAPEPDAVYPLDGKAAVLAGSKLEHGQWSLKLSRKTLLLREPSGDAGVARAWMGVLADVIRLAGKK